MTPRSTKLSKSKTVKESPVKQLSSVKESKSKLSKHSEQESKSKKSAAADFKPSAAAVSKASSNPFGFGVIDEPSQEPVKSYKKSKIDALPSYVKKRDAKAEGKWGSSSSAQSKSKKEVKQPEIKASKPAKFQKRDRSLGKPGFGAVAKPSADKNANKFLGLFSGGSNPFLKPKKF